MAKKTIKDLENLLDNVQQWARDFGFDGNNAIFRDCITDKKGGIREPSDKDSNFWFGYIREDQTTGGAYDGLSFVVFPEYKGSHCLVSIGIGSSSIGKDGELASNPGFRRSFTRLTKANESGAKFFFKLRFDEMETSTPGIQEELLGEGTTYDEVIINTTTKYNSDDGKEAPGLLPAAFIVDYTKTDGQNLIKSWLAQYAQWRNWDKYQKGTDKTKISNNIKNAIDACKCEAECPNEDQIYKTLITTKYVILQGAPGCGKTWSANQIAKKFDEENVIFTQFHAETTYSDFVYGIKPLLNGKDLAYEGEKGVLLKAIEQAESVAQKDKNVLLIIDEINRANLANVLGPVFYLFEPNAPHAHPLNLGTIYDKNSKKNVTIEIKELPKNLFVLATMNTADKSLAVVDFALRRRFTWITLRPHILDQDNFDTEFFNKVDKLFSDYATDEELNLQPGQSYFMNITDRKNSIKYKLIPLMKEYFAEGFLLSAKEYFAQLFYMESGANMYE